MSTDDYKYVPSEGKQERHNDNKPNPQEIKPHDDELSPIYKEALKLLDFFVKHLQNEPAKRWIQSKAGEKEFELVHDNKEEKPYIQRAHRGVPNLVIVWDDYLENKERLDNHNTYEDEWNRCLNEALPLLEFFHQHSWDKPAKDWIKTQAEEKGFKLFCPNRVPCIERGNLRISCDSPEYQNRPASCNIYENEWEDYLSQNRNLYTKNVEKEYKRLLGAREKNDADSDNNNNSQQPAEPSKPGTWIYNYEQKGKDKAINAIKNDKIRITTIVFLLALKSFIENKEAPLGEEYTQALCWAMHMATRHIGTMQDPTGTEKTLPDVFFKSRLLRQINNKITALSNLTIIHKTTSNRSSNLVRQERVIDLETLKEEAKQRCKIFEEEYKRDRESSLALDEKQPSDSDSDNEGKEGKTKTQDYARRQRQPGSMHRLLTQPSSGWASYQQDRHIPYAEASQRALDDPEAGARARLLDNNKDSSGNDPENQNCCNFCVIL